MKSPPRLATRLLHRFLRSDLAEEVRGDLEEKFYSDIKSKSVFKAKLNYWYEVLNYLRPFAIRKSKASHLNNYDMFQSYFKIGWRNLVCNKGYSFINIGGLSLGMVIACLIGLWVWDELSYNQYHTNYERLAQVMQHQTVDGKVGSQQSIPRPLEGALRNSYANDFAYLAMSTWTDEHILSSSDQKIARMGNYAQVDFPEMLSLRMLKGSRQGLKDPSSILLSAAAAKALFGSVDPMNQLVRVDNLLDVKVTGVYEDLPNNSSFKEMGFISSWELYASSQDWMKQAADRWDNNSFQLFAQLPLASDMNLVSEKIKTVRADYSKDKTFKPEIFLHPARDWRLRSLWQNGVQVGGMIQLVWLFGIIGIFVLLLACINFMNLSTARSERRAKEVGIRLTVGSLRNQLINQFLSESFLVVVLAFVIAVGFVALTLPLFNVLADKQIAVEWANPFFWLICLAFILITSLLAGSYPALYLSSFRPVKVLKGTFKVGRSALLPRKVLVVVQFTVSIVLVAGTIVIHNQIQFSKSRPIGYDRNGLIMVPVLSPDFQGKYEGLSIALKNTGAVREVAESSSPLTEVWNNSNDFDWPGKDPNLQSADFGLIAITHEYGKAIDWKIVQGRDLSRDFPSDSTAVLLNEAAVKFIGNESPIGMEIVRQNEKLHVIGVVKDMIVESPYKAVRPHIYLVDNALDRVNWINIKLCSEKNAHESIALIESVFKKIIPSVPFQYKFIDDEYAKKFDLEEHIGKLTSIFALLAIVISCLGLFGLASFVAEQKTKEIGIRKILGASVANLWQMLSKDFVLLVLLSCFIAIPIAYYLMSNLLSIYEYHTEISWWVFVASGMGALLITLLTVSFQAIKAALTNPVNSLKSE